MKKSLAVALPSTRSLVLNGAAGVVILATLVGALRAVVFTPEISRCSERSSQSVSMSLERNGRPIDIEELQGRLGNTDWNLLDNTRVVGLRSGPAQQALEVRTAVKRRAGDDDGRLGVGFHWRPASVSQPLQRACLAYHLFVPEDFNFGSGGFLPGLAGGAIEDSAGKLDLSFRLFFDERGRIDVMANFPGRPADRPLGQKRRPTEIARGSWTDIEQEVIVGEPGTANGTVRIWVDGALAFERENVPILSETRVGLTGVLAEVLIRPRIEDGGKQAPVWLTPLVLKWGEFAR